MFYFLFVIFFWGGANKSSMKLIVISYQWKQTFSNMIFVVTTKGLKIAGHHRPIALKDL